jgi:rubrerythrin
MPQEFTKQQALQQAIQSKKDLYDFYREAAEVTENLAGKMVLQRLCDEVGENIGTEMRKSLDKKVQARKARELAMREEKSIEMSFRLAAQQVIDPVVRNLFIEVADDAARHFAIIESEYEYQMTRIHESDVATYVRE